MNSEEPEKTIREQIEQREREWLWAYESGDYTPDSNLDRVVREGLRSIRFSALAMGENAKSLHLSEARDFLTYLESLFQLLTGIVDTSADPFESSSKKWHECLWIVPNLQNCLQYKGFKPPHPYWHEHFGLRGTPSRDYLKHYPVWRSQTLERVLMQHLVVWETSNFATLSFQPQQDFFSEMTEKKFSKRRSESSEPPFDSLSGQKSRNQKMNFAGFVAYAAVIGLAFAFGSISDSDLKIIAYLGVGGASFFTLVAGLWTLLSLADWFLSPLLFRKTRKLQSERLQLLKDMARFSSEISRATSPKEAESELLRLHKNGAGWLNDTWALLYLSINRGDAFWGEELQNNPEYLKRKEHGDGVDGLTLLSNVVFGNGYVDQERVYHKLKPFNPYS